MSEQIIARKFGFEVSLPPDIEGPGAFVSSPTPPQRVKTVSEHIPTFAHVDHSDTWTEYSGTAGPYDKLSTLTLDFYWMSISTMVTEDDTQKSSMDLTYGIDITDSVVDSFTRSIGAEGGAEGKGLSMKLSASLSETHTEEHSVTVSKVKSQHYDFQCPPHTTKQTWQLFATFTHTEHLPPIDLGMSIDWWEPPYNPTNPKSPPTLTIPTEVTVSRTFPR